MDSVTEMLKLGWGLDDVGIERCMRGWARGVKLRGRSRKLAQTSLASRKCSGEVVLLLLMSAVMLREKILDARCSADLRLLPGAWRAPCAG